MNRESFISTQNLKLAWRRINTGMNIQYKRFFREAYLAYESASNSHIAELHKKLKRKVWKPTHAERLYIPKPSGLQRPLSLLGIEDQIVLQAVANQFSIKLYEKRKTVERKVVFSNILTNKKDSIFFIENWRYSYDAFQSKCYDMFEQGFKWVADFDLAAYYDTISHELLLSTLSLKDKEISNEIKEWFKVWSSENKKTMKEHGIPQGPIASNFLAESFFFPIDKELQKKKLFKYLRYVDDIRLFGETEDQVRKAAIQLEQECRHRGLIPQVKKLGIRKINSANESIGMLPSIPPIQNQKGVESMMTVKQAQKIIRGAVKGRPLKIKNQSRFRYVMYYAPADIKILDTALRLMPRHPEHIDAFVAYFGNYSKSKPIPRQALNYLKSGIPYSYVRGELWHLIARLADKNIMKDALPSAKNDALNRKHCIALSWGVMHFLIKCNEQGLSRDNRRLKSERPFSRSLLAPILPDREFTPQGLIAGLLKKGTLMEKLAASRELQRRKISLHSLNIRPRDLSNECGSTLKAFGVIRRHRRVNQDYIKDILTSLYKCKKISIWIDLLGTEYEHALQILIEAKSRFQSSRSHWLLEQDSFFNTIIIKFLEFLKQKNIPGYIPTKKRNGNLIFYGQLIERDTNFYKKYPHIVEPLYIIHKRRNMLPSSHPYNSKGGMKNQWLNKKEQKNMIPKIKNAINGIIDIVEKNR